MIRKDLIIAILATFCLTATLFLIIPIRSQTTGQYDPSLDVNHDGKIDGKDIALPASIYGTAGNPTVPVNVTNWPTNQPYLIETVSLNFTFTNLENDTGEGYYYYDGYLTSPVIYVGGYSRMWIFMEPPNPNLTSQYAIAAYNVTHTVTSIGWMDSASTAFAAYENFNLTFVTKVSMNPNVSPPLQYPYMATNNLIEVKSPYLILNIASSTLPYEHPGWMNMTIEIYLRNE